MHHIYAQYFHPETLLERVRDVNFYRRPRTLFKGFKVPDWATAEKKHGWELDAYSRQAWDNAMHDMNSEWTPMQFTGERLEPNILQWFRLEQWGKGNSSRLFYNEVPKPTWFRYGGHLDDPNKTLFSFTEADQEHKFVFGIDTTTQRVVNNSKRSGKLLANWYPSSSQRKIWFTLMNKDQFQTNHTSAEFGNITEITPSRSALLTLSKRA